jgi:serine/threonine protein kinase
MPFFCIHCKSEIASAYKACPFCGEAITDFLRRYLETPIDGKYQILARLGVGGMGEVYKSLHIPLNALRVIKLMRSAIAGDDGANERFLREARLATKIHHPNVATLFDFSTFEDGTHFMVWEYIEGINLHELIDQRGPLSPKYAAKLAVQTLLGLDAIHRAGIVHRDISPENLMITRDDELDERVKIIDLGIAKSSHADDNATKTGMFVGKWKYCSPEHLGMLPKGERIDGRADIYSFGIVLYEMLTGVPPFQADTPHAYLMMHSQQQPKPLRETNPQATVSPELEAVIFRALEKDRALRFATAREFAQALEQIAPSLSDEWGAPPPLPPTAEVTNEATRVAAREEDAVTHVSTAQDTPTIITADLEPLLHVGAHMPPPLDRAPSRRRLGFAAMLLAVASVALGSWVVFKDKPTAVGVVPMTAPAPVQAKAVPVPEPEPKQNTQPGRLAINAFPWANVTSIRNLDSREQVELGGKLITPTPVDLAAGRYEVTLSHPQFRKPITRTVTIDPGAEATLTVHFVDPSSAVLPDFGVTR